MKPTKNPRIALERLVAALPGTWTVSRKRSEYVVRVRRAKFDPRRSVSALAILADLATQPLAWGGMGWSLADVREIVVWCGRIPRGVAHEESTLSQIRG